ncbi:MAG: translation initiation factor IF-2 [Thermoplasmata archaeon]|nr:translation initiation factor IF-2 [Thermoplasmata archaeon]
MPIRQPIVSVLGHVDHGKTTLLDKIRGTSVAEREAGLITQHIGATEIPTDTIARICGKMVNEKALKVPGLLFIDTPGHHSFITMRSRGGALADLAILVVDVREGFMPQTSESVNILKKYKTPFVVCANKIDLISGWRSGEACFIHSVKEQTEYAIQELDARIYEIAGRLSDMGLSADRYDRITDFTRNIAIVPVSAKTGEGIPDLLTVLVGLAQRFLENQLEIKPEDGCEGTVLEVKEAKGLGRVIDVIIYKGILKVGDTVLVCTSNGVVSTKVKAIFRPKPLDEIRDPEDRFRQEKMVSAAAGVRIGAQNLDEVIAGTIIRVLDKPENFEKYRNELLESLKPTIEVAEEGIIVKADAVGSIEALGFECKVANIPIKRAEIGSVSKHDVVETGTNRNPFYRAILAFNVRVQEEAAAEAAKQGVKIIGGNIVYKLIEDYEKWRDEERQRLEEEKRKSITYPAKIKILPGCIFRVSKPAIVGVRVLAGRLRQNMPLMREDGVVVGRVRSIQSENKPINEAIMGMEVAISIEGPTVGRQINEGDILYTSITEDEYRELRNVSLSFEESEALAKIVEIKKRENSFWGL